MKVGLGFILSTFKPFLVVMHDGTSGTLLGTRSARGLMWCVYAERLYFVYENAIY